MQHEMSVERSLPEDSGIDLNDPSENYRSDYNLIKTSLYDEKIAEIKTVGDECTLDNAVYTVYKKQLEQCEKALEKSLDLYALVGIAVSSGAMHGLPALVSGLTLIATALEQRWDDCYPAIKESKPANPAIERYNALYVLSGKKFKSRYLNRLPLVFSSNKQPLSLHAYFVAYQSDEQNKVNGIFGNDAEKKLYQPEWIQSLLLTLDTDTVENIRTALSAGLELTKSGGTLATVYMNGSAKSIADCGGTGFGTMLDFSSLHTCFKSWDEIFTKHVLANTATNPSTENGSPDEHSPRVVGSGGAKQPSDVVRNNDDVVLILDCCMVYFLEKEPANPALFFSAFAKGVLPLQFLEWMNLLVNSSASTLKGRSKDFLAALDSLLLDSEIDKLQNFIDPNLKGVTRETVEARLNDEGAEHDTAIQIPASREAAMQMLRQSVSYLRMNQPSNPVIIILQRAIDVTVLSFSELLASLAAETKKEK